MSPRGLAVYPTYKKIEYVPLFLRWRNTKNKNTYLIYRRFKRGDDIFDTKTLNLADVSSSSTCKRDQLVVANSREQVYFEPQILVCFSFIKLTTCHAQNLLTFQDKLRVCASREAGLKAHRMKPSILRQMQP